MATAAMGGHVGCLRADAVLVATVAPALTALFIAPRRATVAIASLAVLIWMLAVGGALAATACWTRLRG